jgi:hypothetical protein
MIPSPVKYLRRGDIGEGLIYNKIEEGRLRRMGLK